MGVSRPATDAATWHPMKGQSTASVSSERRSLYLPMRDNVRLAVDVHLPSRGRAEGRPLPTLVHQTRYHRGVSLRWPFGRHRIEALLDNVAATRRRFLAAGYAWVDVCARGSGASFGSRPCPWSPDEVADGAEIVDWIVAQPWSDGAIGATGVSYDGTAAEMLLVNEHPAVRAVAPRFSLFDVYRDVAFPGGIHLAWFTENWRRFNAALDANRLDRAIAMMVRAQLEALSRRRWQAQRHVLDGLLQFGQSDMVALAVAAAMRRVATGVRPVDADRRGGLLADALEGHEQNYDVHQSALAMAYRDDRQLAPQFPDATIDLFSPHTYRASLAATGAAIYSYSGWADGGYPHAAVKRFRTVQTPGSRLILGPWDHGGSFNVSPYGPPGAAAFDHGGELLRFFDYHLRGIDEGLGGEPPVRYFTVGEERWKTADQWPPKETRLQSWHLSDRRALERHQAAGVAVDRYQVDGDTTSGPRSRWNALLGLFMAVDYPDRVEQGARSLVYRSKPLRAPMEVTGHPIVTLYVASNKDDATLFAYLEDEHPDGRVDYVTEGQLRALHRKVSTAPRPTSSPTPFHSFERADAAPLARGKPAEITFDLLPISWRFAVGHRLRLALAGADRDHFAQLPDKPLLGFFRGEAHPSRIDLPVITRGGTS